jgi:hypothetical protein
VKFPGPAAVPPGVLRVTLPVTAPGKEVQSKTVGVLFAPRPVKAGVVIRGIVGEDHHPSPGPAAG